MEGQLSIFFQNKSRFSTGIIKPNQTWLVDQHNQLCRQWHWSHHQSTQGKIEVIMYFQSQCINSIIIAVCSCKRGSEKFVEQSANVSNKNSVCPKIHTLIKLMVTISYITVSVENSIQIEIVKKNGSVQVYGTVWLAPEASRTAL